MPPPTMATSQPVLVSRVTLLVLASESITCGRVYQSFRPRGKNTGARHARRGAPGARGRAAGAALAAREGTVRRRLVPPRRLPRAGRDAGALHPEAPRGEG